MSAVSTEAQQAEGLTLQELIPGGKNYARCSPRIVRQMGFVGEMPYWQIGDTLYACDGRKRQGKVYVTRKELNEVIGARGLSAAKRFPTLTVPRQADGTVGLMADEWFVQYDFMKRAVKGSVEMKARYENRDVSPSNQHVAFTSDNNLYVASLEGEVEAVTKERNREVVCGQSVHRNEFGIRKGTFWSPSGAFLAFYRMDESMVTSYPGIDISARVAELESFKYPMVGMKSHQVTVGIYDVRRDKVHYLRTGKPVERYFTNIAWSADEKSLLVAEINRGQDSCAVVQYNVADGRRVKTLFVETSATWVEPEEAPLFVDNNRFLWVSQRDGYRHVYLYDMNGTCLAQLTKGEWVVTRLIGLDAKRGTLMYESTEGSPLDVRVCSLDLATGKRQVLTPAGRVALGAVSASGKELLYQYSSVAEARGVVLKHLGSGTSHQLLKQVNPLAGYQIPSIEVGTIKAADGETDLYYRMVKPLNYQEGVRYPVILYVYGGPHAQMINHSFNYGVRGWDLYMAQQGYVVFTLDNRGTANRGVAFESVIHRRLGEVEMQDQLQGVEFLRQQPFVDASRIGVHGWSYGGFMTTSLMLHHGDVFKVGIAGGAVMDWRLYEVMYGERYMGQLRANKAGYEATNLCAHAHKLKGKLLIIHDDQDPVVVLQHALRFIKACVETDTHPDFFVFPGHLHNVSGKDRVYLYERATRYFMDNL